jgi:hypothetical protein
MTAILYTSQERGGELIIEFGVRRVQRGFGELGELCVFAVRLFRARLSKHNRTAIIRVLSK